MRIDIFSDVVCPWCYLGDHRFREAVARLPWQDEVTIRHRAYQLDPHAPHEPTDLRATIERKYGVGAFDGMTKRLTALGAAEGLEYRFDLAQRVNTRDAHRLLAWAGEQDLDRQAALVERLFLAYFTEGRNVADPEVLRQAAVAAGLPEAEAQEVIESDQYAAQIEEDQRAAMERDISGVPAFVIEDSFLIPGAQDVDTIEQVLLRARQKLGATPA